MPIEVEIKARVGDRSTVDARLSQFGAGADSTYQDTYYDWPDGGLERGGRQELRVRVVESTGGRRVLLTYKGTMLDGVSTPEHETLVADATAVDAILAGLGLVHTIAYQKHCRNYVFRAHGHDVTATVVEVPELADEAFVEIEAIVETHGQVAAATTAIRNVLSDLGLGEDDVTGEFYVDRVRRRRSHTA